MLIPALLAVHLMGVQGGFLIVVSARQQLFTENTLTVVLPLMTHPHWHELWRLLRLWGSVIFSLISHAQVRSDEG